VSHSVAVNETRHLKLALMPGRARAFGRRHEDESPQGQDPDSVGAWFTTAVPQAVPILVFLSVISPMVHDRRQSDGLPACLRIH